MATGPALSLDALESWAAPTAAVFEMVPQLATAVGAVSVTVLVDPEGTGPNEHVRTPAESEHAPPSAPPTLQVNPGGTWSVSVTDSAGSAPPEATLIVSFAGAPAGIDGGSAVMV